MNSKCISFVELKKTNDNFLYEIIKLTSKPHLFEHYKIGNFYKKLLSCAVCNKFK